MSARDASPAATAARAATAAPDGARALWRLAFIFAVAAVASGVLLTGVSVWFLGAVALAGLGPAAFAFNFHFPAALVRLFALTRTGAKYGERIVGHQAALADQVSRRIRLFAAMAAAPSVRAGGWQLGNQDRLSDYMDDVEDVDFARLRVGMPTATLVASSAMLVVATLALVPLAILPVAVLALVTALAIRRTLPVAQRDWNRARLSQRAAGRRLGSVVAATVPLQAERAWSERLGTVFTSFTDAGTAKLGLRWSLAALDTLLALLGPLAALSVLAAAWHAGTRGEGLLVPAFIAFAWLALGETVQGLSRAVLGKVRERAAGAGLAQWSGGEGAAEASAPDATSLRALTLHDVPLQTPAGRPLGGSVSIALAAGRATALVGASGTGKTTLLKGIAGWLGDDAAAGFASEGAPLHGAARRALAYLSPHDAAVLSDTIRENLFAPNASEAELMQALAAVELEGRVGTAGGLDGWISQDMLSLGEAQRLSLARAMLSAEPLVLLDEPTEHLDTEQGIRILKRVLDRLSDRIVVYATHDLPAAELAAQTVDCAMQETR